jgi:hypothetical protein
MHGGANLDLRIGVVSGIDQWIETARGPDFGDLLRGFQAHVAILVLKVTCQLRNGGPPGFGRLPDVLRAHRLLRACG